MPDSDKKMYDLGVNAAIAVIEQRLMVEAARRQSLAEDIPDGPHAKTLRESCWETAGAIILACSLALEEAHKLKGVKELEV